MTIYLLYKMILCYENISEMYVMICLRSTSLILCQVVGRTNILSKCLTAPDLKSISTIVDAVGASSLVPICLCIRSPCALSDVFSVQWQAYFSSLLSL